MILSNYVSIIAILQYYFNTSYTPPSAEGNKVNEQHSTNKASLKKIRLLKNISPKR